MKNAFRNTFKKMMNNEKGFTLVELIIVIAILGILAAMLVPRFAGFTEQARKTADRSFGASVANALLIAETGTARGTLSNAASPNNFLVTLTATAAGSPITFATAGDVVVRGYTASAIVAPGTSGNTVANILADTFGPTARLQFYTHMRIYRPANTSGLVVDYGTSATAWQDDTGATTTVTP